MAAMGLWVVLTWMLAGLWPARRREWLRSRKTLIAPVRDSSARNQRKPPWVITEILGLKALSPGLSCRVIADIFNRRFAVERRMTVGKTFVAALLRTHRAEITRLRRQIKHRVPRPMPVNQVWALDLTGKADLTGRQRIILGLLDHGSRGCLRVSELADKSSLTILRTLIGAFRQFGVPKALRTDNEACLNSRTLRFALLLVGIRHQRTDPHCPWQNGRIERFFGTLKAQLDRIAMRDADDLRSKLIEFRAWYNHVRPHQHLGGRTPAEAWAGRDRSRRKPTFFAAWDGRLSGWHFPP